MLKSTPELQNDVVGITFRAFYSSRMKDRNTDGQPIKIHLYFQEVAFEMAADVAERLQQRHRHASEGMLTSLLVEFWLQL